MLAIIIIGVSFFLDGILSNFLPYLNGDLSYFTPLLTIVSLFLVYPMYSKQKRKYYLTAMITGLIYDLFYTNLLFFNAILFLIMALVIEKIHKNLEITYIKTIVYMIGIITLYEGLTALTIAIGNLVPITLEKVIYKITHSLLLNILYTEIILWIINKLPKKYKKIPLN